MKPPVGMFAPVNRVKIASPRKIPKPSAKSLSDVANGVNVLDSWQMPPVAMRINASHLARALPDPVESRESDETVVVEINAAGVRRQRLQPGQRRIAGSSLQPEVLWGVQLRTPSQPRRDR